jgi:hypothetical protein
MTWEEEVADQVGITEKHDKTCQGEYLSMPRAFHRRTGRGAEERGG